MVLRARQFEIRFPRPALVMGIVNVTPDSFSDGGRFLEPAAAMDRVFQLVEHGAEIIDIGGESTRPNAVPVPEAEELRRVVPVLEGIAGQVKALISIDTAKPAVAREALAAGACMVNDVGATAANRAMWELVAGSGAAYVAMHMKGTPQTMQADPRYADVNAEVGQFCVQTLDRLREAGVHPDQTVLDVGIGFGKRREHNLSLLSRLGQFNRFGRPLLIGISRKSFLGQSLPVNERLPAALACTCWCVRQGAQIVRTHDVKETVRAIRMTEELAAAAGKENS